MDEKMLQILEDVSKGVKTPKQARKDIYRLFNVNSMLFDFFVYIRNGTQETPIKEIKNGIKTFLINYKQ